MKIICNVVTMVFQASRKFFWAVCHQASRKGKALISRIVYNLTNDENLKISGFDLS